MRKNSHLDKVKDCVTCTSYIKSSFGPTCISNFCSFLEKYHKYKILQCNSA